MRRAATAGRLPRTRRLRLPLHARHFRPGDPPAPSAGPSPPVPARGRCLASTSDTPGPMPTRRPPPRHAAFVAPAALAPLVAACLTLACRDSDGAAPARDRRQPPADATRDAALADTLGRLVADAYDFSRPGAVDRLVGLYAPHDPVVSASGGRVTTSRALLAQSIDGFWARVGRNMRDPRFVLRERYATALGPDAAVLTMTYAIPHLTPEGRPHTVAGAWTAVFQRQGGRWVIVQEHLSDLPSEQR